MAASNDTSMPAAAAIGPSTENDAPLLMLLFVVMLMAAAMICAWIEAGMGMEPLRYPASVSATARDEGAADEDDDEPPPRETLRVLINIEIWSASLPLPDDSLRATLKALFSATNCSSSVLFVRQYTVWPVLSEIWTTATVGVLELLPDAALEEGGTPSNRDTVVSMEAMTLSWMMAEDEMPVISTGATRKGTGAGVGDGDWVGVMLGVEVCDFEAHSGIVEGEAVMVLVELMLLELVLEPVVVDVALLVPVAVAVADDVAVGVDDGAGTVSMAHVWSAPASTASHCSWPAYPRAAAAAITAGGTRTTAAEAPDDEMDVDVMFQVPLSKMGMPLLALVLEYPLIPL